MPFTLRTKSNNSATAEVEIDKMKKCHIFINRKVMQTFLKFIQSKNQLSWALWIYEQQHIMPSVFDGHMDYVYRPWNP